MGKRLTVKSETAYQDRSNAIPFFFKWGTTQSNCNVENTIMNTKRLNPTWDYNVSKAQKEINEYYVDKS